MEQLPIEYRNSGKLLDDAKFIVETARAVAYRSVNVALVQRNWLLGKRISEEELKGADRAEYGTYIIDTLAAQLTGEYGAGFDRRSLYMFLQFFKRFPIVDSLSPKSGGLLSWTHYRKLLQVENPDALKWYRLCLPKEEDLRKEIERQREIFLEQHELKENTASGGISPTRAAEGCVNNKRGFSR